VQVAITAHGAAYQRMAALAARTYRACSGADAIAVQVPDGEAICGDLSDAVADCRLILRRFSWTPPAVKPHAGLKIAGWRLAIREAALVLHVDADTCCQAELKPSASLLARVREGAIAAAPDRKPGWPSDRTDPWFVASPRPVYVNSGVLLLSTACEPVVLRCEELCGTDALAEGRYGDQRVLNYALATGGRCVMLRAEWNAIRPRIPRRARVLHFAGAGGDPDSSSRQWARHARACTSVLDSQGRGLSSRG
jgi:hypothetical protein